MPREPRAKEIGRIAKNHFQANIPLNWLVTSLDGDEDYGLDYLIQFKNNKNDITYNFFVQLKGVEDKSKILNSDISIRLKSHTLNYYQNNGLVLVVACDINTKEYYYQFLHTILLDLYGNERYFDDSEKEYTIKVPKSQKVDTTLNIEHVLESYARGNHTNQREYAIKNESDIVTIYEDTKQDYETRQILSGNTFLYQKGRVFVQAFVPYEYNFSISMLIIFKITDIEKAMITPSEEDILRILFSGYKSKPNSNVRKWLIGQYEDKFVLQVGNVRLDIPTKVLVDFSDILDSLFDIYCERIKSFEETLQARLFQPSKKYCDGYKLVKIKRGLWYLIHEFAKNYGYKDDDTEWHIFGYDNHSLRVNFKDREFIWSGNIIISPELDNSYVNFKSIDDEVVLVWTTLPYEKYKRKNIESKIFNLEDSYKWLIEKLIPKIMYEYENSLIKPIWYDNFFKINRKIEYRIFVEEFNISKYIVWDYRYEDAKCYESNKEKYLVKLVNELQSFYHQQNNIFLNIEILVNLYEGIVILLKESTHIDIKYLCGNLGNISFKQELNKDNLIVSINRHIEQLTSSTSNDFLLDLLLRCYVVLVEDNIKQFSNDLIIIVIDKLQSIIKLKENLKIKSRMLERF